MQMVVHEHLVHLHPIGYRFTRTELWEAIKYVTIHPELVLPHIEGIIVKKPEQIDSREWLSLEIDFGKIKVIEKIEFFPMSRIIHTIYPTEFFPESGLTVEVEEESEEFNLRFIYTEQEERCLDKELKEEAKIRHLAWEAKDKSFCEEVLKILRESKLNVH